jgi:hypothetical protein
MLELIRASGTNVPCDLTSEDFDLPISGMKQLSALEITPQ